ncbi:MAG: GAF domain-containing protein [Anaerolineales bacterium]|nr:GAF domain-containing protein [Anaerolineales bacterium]
MKQRFSIQDWFANLRDGRLNLRGKITVGNMAITFIVIVIVGAYISSRIQSAGQQLIDSVDANARSRAEEELVSANSEQAAFLESFFVSMQNAAVVASSTMRNILINDQLADTTYWDAASRLHRLPSGALDNSNAEASSVYLPANIPLTDALSKKLNLLKYSEMTFPAMLKGNPDIVALYFGGESKELIYYPNIDFSNIAPEGFDPTKRDWYIAARPNNNPQNNIVWSAPYEDAANHGIVITISAPIIDRLSRFQGVIGMDIQLKRVTELISGAKIGETGYAFLVDSQGQLLSLPQNGYTDFRITDDSAKVSAIVNPSELSSVSSELSQMLEKVQADPQGMFTIIIRGARRHIVFDDIPEVNYKLVYVVPSSELFSGREAIVEQISAETRSTVNVSMLLIAAIFIIAAAASFFISSYFTSPLNPLNEAAGEIAKGNFDTYVVVKSRDELQTLAATFNTMANAIKDLVTSLEKRVSERTADLQRVNQEGERRRKQYEAIAKVAQSIGVRQNLRELLPQITQVISEQFNFYHVGIFLNDAAQKYAVLVAANSEGGRRMLERGHQLRIGSQGIVGYATETKRARIALDVGYDSVYFNNPDLPETRSEVALPLVEGDVILGALDAQSKESNAFSDKDLEALSILADLVGIAIQNAKLYDQMDRSLAEAESASRQFFSENWSRLSQESQIAGYRYTAQGASPISTAEDEEAETPSDRKQVQVPIVIHGLEVGELSIAVPTTETIRSNQMDLVRAVADRVAVIAENARLFDETRRRAERERLVSDITTKIRGTNDPQEMIATAVKELREALKVSRVEITSQKNPSSNGEPQ